MGVICLASLKGGVGKTSLAVNLAHSFAKRGCRTLLVDLDPSAHSSRFFLGAEAQLSDERVSLAHVFLAPRKSADEQQVGYTDLLDAPQVIRPVRTNLELLPGGPELRHFFSGKGSQAFARRFSPLIDELLDIYDHIVIDTSPDFNVLTRGALAVSDIAAVPVDSSEMSIFSLESLITSAQHLKKPIWCIVRTMVNKKAARTKGLSEARMQQRLSLPKGSFDCAQTGYDIEDPADFMRMLQEWERVNRKPNAAHQRDNRPIYLLRSLIYRTEQQNQLSFVGRTALDNKATAQLGEHYLAVARELEGILSARDGDPAEMEGTGGALAALTSARPAKPEFSFRTDETASMWD